MSEGAGGQSGNGPPDSAGASPGATGPTPGEGDAPTGAGAPPARILDGRTVVITRAEDRATTLIEVLESHGARVLSIPTIRFAPPGDGAPLQEALDSLERYTWLFFTSSTGVSFFFDAARKHGVPAGAWSEKRFGVVGPTTASRLASMGVQGECIIIGGKADALADLLLGASGTGAAGGIEADQHCLLLQADIARTDLQDRLRAAGIPVHSVVTYRTLPEAHEKARPFLEVLERDEPIDAITFASPSAFQNFLEMTRPHGEDAIRGRPIPLFSIGPTTSQAIRSRGFEVARQASPYTGYELIQCVIRHLQPDVAEEKPTEDLDEFADEE